MNSMATRRKLLSAVPGCAMSVAAFAPHATAVAPSEPLELRLSRLLTTRANAQRIGKRLLTDRPHEADAPLLSRFLAGSAAEYERMRRSNQIELRQFIRARVRLDFQTGRVIHLGGWVLAETEARLCAIAALAATE